MKKMLLNGLFAQLQFIYSFPFLNRIIFKSKWSRKCFHLLVSIKRNNSICDGSADAGQGSQYSIHVTTQLVAHQPLVEGVGDEERHLQHHHQVEHGEVYHEHVAWTAQGF